MFNEQLKLIRKASGKTQKELAEYLQISAQSVSKWEKGESLPTIEYLPLIAKFFGCSVNTFFLEFKDGEPKRRDKDISKIKETLELEEKINCALRHFNINVEVKKIHHGIRILTFVIEMYEGVGISDINKRAKDIIHYIGEENVTFNSIDYKSNTFAIEISKKKFKGVPLELALESEEYINSNHSLPIIIGYDSGDNLIIDDLACLPHLLMTGCSGSGKSVFIRNIITCLTSRFSPDEVQFLISDLKMCEFGYLRGCSHLWKDVITSCQDTVNVMNEVIEMMNTRYAKFADLGVRNIKDYNNASKEKMPRLVIIIDELADVMLQMRQIEDLIIKIGMKGRAAGIHMLLASQRSSVNVFTGVIKANCPARASLRVATSVESKTILDEAGAENLSLDGDMLYKSSWNKSAVRVQVPFIEEYKVLKLVKNK